MRFQIKYLIFLTWSVISANKIQVIPSVPWKEGKDALTDKGGPIFKEYSSEMICSNNYSDAKYSLIGAKNGTDKRKFTCFSPAPIEWSVELDYGSNKQGSKRTLNKLPYSIESERKFCNAKNKSAGNEYFESSLYFNLKHLNNGQASAEAPNAAIIGCANRKQQETLYIKITWSKLSKALKFKSKPARETVQCAKDMTMESDNLHSRFICKSWPRASLQPVNLTYCHDWTNCVALANFLSKDPCQLRLVDSAGSFCLIDPLKCIKHDTENVAGMLSCHLKGVYNSFVPFFRHRGKFVYVPLLSETLTELSKLGIRVSSFHLSQGIKFRCSAPKFIAVPGFRWTLVFNDNKTLAGTDVCMGEQKTDFGYASFSDVCICKRCLNPSFPILVQCNVFLQTGHNVTVVDYYPRARLTATFAPETNSISSTTQPAIPPTAVAPTIENWKFIAAIFGAGVGVCSLLLLPILIFYRRKVGRQTNALKISKEVHDNFIQGIEMMNTIAPNTQQTALVLPYDYSLEISRETVKIDARPLVLGEGVFGKVVRATIAYRFVAIKTCKPTQDGQPLKALLSELKIMSFVGKHSNIVELIGANTERLKKQDVWIIFEFCENGNALHYIRSKRNVFVNQLSEDLLSYQRMSSDSVEYANASTKKFCSEDLVRWSYEIACGMDYIASKNVYHGDLAARNILLTRGLVAKVGDFGLAKQLTDYSLYVQRIECPLPLKWLSIEALRDLEFSIQSDVWSFGIALWEMFSLGSTPYPGMDWNFQAWKNLQDGERMDRPECATQSIYGILRKCWKTLPQDRPKFADLKKMLRDELDIIGERRNSSSLC